MNQPLEEESFDGLRQKVVAHLDPARRHSLDEEAVELMAGGLDGGADPARRGGYEALGHVDQMPFGIGLP